MEWAKKRGETEAAFKDMMRCWSPGSFLKWAGIVPLNQCYGWFRNNVFEAKPSGESILINVF